MVKAIVGANWGDEGKGKITDMFAEQADVVIRFQGGANAGHTIINDYGRFALHTLPSGVFYPNITNIIGNGVALDIRKLVAELQMLLDGGVSVPKLIVSDRAHVLMPYHVLLDTYEEDRLAGKAYGSTKSGIAPFYADKVSKIGIQVNELFDDDVLRERLEKVCQLKNALIVHLYHKDPLDPQALYEEMVQQRELIRPYVGDAARFVHTALREAGIHKVALGHHYDDAVETFFLSLFYEGRLSCFHPVTYLDRMDITQIRPLLYVSEAMVREAAQRLQLPVVHNPCPADGATKRQEVKDLIAGLQGQYPKLKEYTFAAMQRLPLPGWEVEDLRRRPRTE